jgi:hypothetical protein
MKYTFEMGSGTLIYIPNFIKIGSTNEKLIGNVDNTAWSSLKPIFFNNESGLKRSKFKTLLLLWDSVIGIATVYWLEVRRIGVDSPVGSRIFLTGSRQVLRPTHHPIQWVQGVKRQWREADHL